MWINKNNWETMLISCLVALMVVVCYTWFFVWSLGYHGVFGLIIYVLWFVLYNSCWDLYNCWVYDYVYYGTLFNWVELGNGIVINMSYHIDLVSVLIMVIMSGGSLIVVFFVYIEMWDDKEGVSFVILLMLFIVWMGVLVVSGNLIVFYLGWEGIGLISLFLISFWTERVRSVKAAFKVFSINKIGDCLLLYIICIIIGYVGCTEFDFFCIWNVIFINMYSQIGSFNVELIHLISVLVVVAGGVKSAQFGFHIWLLEAMEAPLGASALMHSSTLVIAGVILVYKLYSLIEMSWIALSILMIWGSWTALFASFVACWQFELKIILAYSTISSMGFLYMLLGFGALSEVVVYLVSHAFIKIFLFLVVGLIMTHCNGMQDLRWMGGMFQYMGYGFVLYFWGAVGLAGLPYWSGYYCKAKMWIYVSSTYSIIRGCHLCIIISNLCTYIYLIRTGILVFGGSKRGHRSIYREMKPAGFVIVVMFSLMCVMLYFGIMWIEFIERYYRGIYFNWNRYLQIFFIHYRMLNLYGWLVISTIYVIVFLILIWLICLWCTGDKSNFRLIWHLKKWFWFIIWWFLS